MPCGNAVSVENFLKRQKVSAQKLGQLSFSFRVTHITTRPSGYNIFFEFKIKRYFAAYANI